MRLALEMGACLAKLQLGINPVCLQIGYHLIQLFDSIHAPEKKHNKPINKPKNLPDKFVYIITIAKVSSSCRLLPDQMIEICLLYFCYLIYV